jgi:hypothetical protein
MDGLAPPPHPCKIEIKIIYFIIYYKMDKTELNPQVKTFLESLTPKQYKAYLIAKEHLRDSFDIYKSNAFLAWLKKNNS